MNLLKKIKLELDEKVAKDTAEEMQNGDVNERFSLKNLFDGRILIKKSFFKVFGLIAFMWALTTFWLMPNRYAYEKLLRQQTNLNTELEQVESEKKNANYKFTQVSTRNAIKQKLHKTNKNLSDNHEKVIEVEK